MILEIKGVRIQNLGCKTRNQNFEAHEGAHFLGWDTKRRLHQQLQTRGDHIRGGRGGAGGYDIQWYCGFSSHMVDILHKKKLLEGLPLLQDMCQRRLVKKREARQNSSSNE
jgi:hypothetical protein